MLGTPGIRRYYGLSIGKCVGADNQQGSPLLFFLFKLRKLTEKE